MRLLATLTLPHATGLVQDNVQNSLAVDTAPAWDPATQVGQVSIPLHQFFTRAVGGVTVGSYISPVISRAALAAKSKFYDVTAAMNGQPHGSPVATDSFTLPAAAASQSLPEEVAVGLTIRGSGWDRQAIEAADGADPDAQPDRPRQRYTGRIFISPLMVNALADDATGRPRPAPALRQLLVDSLALTQAELMANGHSLAVWSRKAGAFRRLQAPGLLPSQLFVDNAFDTQRRRGAARTSVTTKVLTS